MVLFLLLCGASLVRTITPGEPRVTDSAEPGYATVLLENTRRAAPSGHPLLPLVPVVLAVQGEAGEVRVSLDRFSGVSISLPVEPAHNLRPIGSLSPRIALPHPEVYLSDSVYPDNPLVAVSVGKLMGTTIVTCMVSPWRYNPLKGTIEIAGEVTVTLDYTPAMNPAPLSPLQSEVAARRIKALTGSEPPPMPLGSPGSAQYLVITGDPYLPVVQQILDFHSQRGLTTRAVGMSQVIMAYGGVRECIRWHYENEGTVFVLLAGDHTVVPAKDIWVGCPCENLWEYAPVDLYYACLDGDWDGDGDGVPGQPQDNPDLYPEVILGRALFSNYAGAQAFIDKTIAYATDPPPGNWASTAVLNGAKLFSDIGYVGAKGCEEMAQHFPQDWDIIRSYEFGLGDYPDTFFEPIASGAGWNHYAGHGNNRGVYWATFASQVKVADRDRFENGFKAGIHTSIACHSGDFTQPGTSLVKMLLTNESGGGVAAAMNTSWGWEGFWPELGPSEDMCTDMARLVFKDHIPTLGEAVTTARDIQVPLASGGYDRTFQSLLVFTAFMDPALEVLRVTSPPPPPPPLQVSVSLGGANPARNGEAVFDVDFAKGPVALNIFDIAGRLVYNTTLDNPGQVRWDCSQMPAGVYTAVAGRDSNARGARFTVLR